MRSTKTIARFAFWVGATVTAVVGGLSSAAQAYQFQLGESKTVQIEFLESHGSYKSALKLYDANKTYLSTVFAETKAYDTRDNDYAGYCGPGKSVAQCWVNVVLAKGTIPV
jgi:hypothetical protein